MSGFAAATTRDVWVGFPVGSSDDRAQKRNSLVMNGWRHVWLASLQDVVRVNEGHRVVIVTVELGVT